MSLPLHTPQHQFTSTLNGKYHHSGFNIYIVIITALIFFLILTFYNFVLAVYNYYTGYNPDGVKNVDARNFRIVLQTLGFLLVWLAITAVIYAIFKCQGALNSDYTVDTKPKLRAEAGSIDPATSLTAII